MSSSDVALFLFHRDLRLQDNTALIECIKEGHKILPVFIFPPEQIDPKQNEYFSEPAVQFMCESLREVEKEIRKVGGRLYYFKGDTIKVLNSIRKQVDFDQLWFNEDYSKYATERDDAVQKWCNKHKIKCETREDYSLLAFEDCFVKPNKPYEVFSPFYKRFQTFDIREPVKLRSFKGKFVKSSVKDSLEGKDIDEFYQPNKKLAFHGGRTNGLKMLRRIQTLKDYKEDRDYPSLDQTSHASPHLKFGTVSIREMYHEVKDAFGKDHGIIRELAFREFYLRIYAFYPELQRDVALHDKLDERVKWSYSKKIFKLWCEGKTGFPFVDAGMRQLNQTGYQHNRVRMICASLLTKYLLIDWRWGAKYYYQHLVDADIFSNTAGWGFVSSTGPDPSPYFRSPFNPFLQSKKFDEDAEYIKEWLPELRDVSASDIHKWYDSAIREKYSHIDYPKPMVDYQEAAKNAVEEFKRASRD